MIINDSATILRSIYQAMSTNLVNKPSRPAGETKYFIHSIIRKNIMFGASVSKVPFHIFANLGPVEVR